MIEFHYSFILVALSFILTGYFSNLLVFTSIIIVHELGHYIAAKLNKLNIEKIIIYPYGGLTKMNNLLNVRISSELIVACAGIIFQIIYYMIIVLFYENGIIRDYIFNLFKEYHYSMLFFNLLPIHPLDGSKILNLLLSKVFPYKLANKLNVIISVIVIALVFGMNYYQFNYTTILIVSVIIDSLVKYYRNINYLFNKFLLERYLYRISFCRSMRINKIENMYRDRYHVIRENNTYVTEKRVLNRRFGGKF